jgi:hypothetical protein
MGKGSTARPIPDREKYESNWDAIFGKNDKKQEEKPEEKKDEKKQDDEHQ